MIVAAMEKKELSIRDMALKMDTAYEHMRRIVRGESIPSKLMLRAICTLLEIDFHEAEKASTSDHITKKYGDIPAELSGKNPELTPIEKAWRHLNEDQKRDAITMVQGWAKRNKALGLASV